MTTADSSSSMFEQWEEQAEENIEKWGDQDPALLALVLGEEIGELADEILATGEESIHNQMYSSEASILLSEMRSAGFKCSQFLERHYYDEDGEPLLQVERPLLYTDVDTDRVESEVGDVAPVLIQLIKFLEKMEEE